jgi:transposase
MDRTRRSEYKRLDGDERRYIKGQRYTLLSHWKNLDQEGRQSLKELFRVNRRLNNAYLLKEHFGQLWDYYRPEWARKFFAKWKASLRWQRLPEFEKFAAMIEKHWDGIIPYCDPDNKVSLGLVEGLNNLIIKSHSPM